MLLPENIKEQLSEMGINMSQEEILKVYDLLCSRIENYNTQL